MKAVLLIATMVFFFGLYTIDIFVLPLAVAVFAFFVSYVIADGFAYKSLSNKKAALVISISVIFLIVSVSFSLRFPKDMESVYLCRDFFEFLKIRYY